MTLNILMESIFNELSIFFFGRSDKTQTREHLFFSFALLLKQGDMKLLL